MARHYNSQTSGLSNLVADLVKERSCHVPAGSLSPSHQIEYPPPSSSPAQADVWEYQQDQLYEPEETETQNSCFTIHYLVNWYWSTLFSHCLVCCVPSCLVPGICPLPCVSVAGSTRLQRRHQPRIPCHQCHCTNAHCQSSCNQLQKYKRQVWKKLKMG